MQTGRQSHRHWQNCLFAKAIGVVCMALSGCAEVELGAEIFKNIPRSGNVPVARPILQAATRPDSIEPSLRPDRRVFRATGLALWDGSQTLPGVWIAHPTTEIARRVRITNEETGTQVDAAMFRRDPNLSGPQLIVSSEAAELLALTPGHGTPITVEGLAYRVDLDAEIDVASVPGEPDPVAVEVVAIEPIEPEVIPDAAVDEVAPIASDPAPGIVVEQAPEAVVVLDPVPTPEPAPEIAPVLTSSEVPPVEVVAGNPTVPIVPDEVKNDVTVATATESRQTTVVDARLAAIIPPSRPTVRSVPPAPSEPSEPSDIADGRRFIQAGVFSQPENATRLVATLRGADLPANQRSITLGERKLTLVLVGPFQTIAERTDALEVIRRIGPSDATPSWG